MSETIGATIYLVLALTVAVGIRAIVLSAGSRKELNFETALAETLEEEAQPLNEAPEDVLPWVTPLALTPPVNTNYRPPITREEISEMFKKIDFQLSQDNRLDSQKIGGG